MSQETFFSLGPSKPQTSLTNSSIYFLTEDATSASGSDTQHTAGGLCSSRGRHQQRQALRSAPRKGRPPACRKQPEQRAEGEGHCHTPAAPTVPENQRRIM